MDSKTRWDGDSFRLLPSLDNRECLLLCPRALDFLRQGLKVQCGIASF